MGGQYVSVLDAQKFIILTSLGVIGVLLVFYVIAPVFGYPLEFEHSIRLIQINTPIFLGYLGSATQFLFTGNTARSAVIDEQLAPLLRILLVGPIVVFAIATVACLIAFGLSNAKSASPGIGMTIENLSVLLTAALGLLAVTSSVFVSYLFSTAEKTN